MSPAEGSRSRRWAVDPWAKRRRRGLPTSSDWQHYFFQAPAAKGIPSMVITRVPAAEPPTSREGQGVAAAQISRPGDPSDYRPRQPGFSANRAERGLNG